jgi:hypothetical protein
VTAGPGRPLGFDPFRASVVLGGIALLLSWESPDLEALVAALGALACAAWAARRRSVGRTGRRAGWGVLVPVALAALAGGEVWTFATVGQRGPPFGAALVEGSLLLLGRASAGSAPRRPGGPQ